MVVTLAFGMEINKPDVRFVVHYTIPKSIESYSQESRLTGRDGQHSQSLLLFAQTDKQRVKSMISVDIESGMPRSGESLRIELALLDAMDKPGRDQVTRRRQMALNYFSGDFNAYNYMENWDNCVNNASELMKKTLLTWHRKRQP
jgi:superfamily II DNA helicase RecQ